MRLALFSALKTNQSTAIECSTRDEIEIHNLAAKLEGDSYINSKINTVYNHKCTSKVK